MPYHQDVELADIPGKDHVTEYTVRLVRRCSGADQSQPPGYA
jgi:hypothetical protein